MDRFLDGLGGKVRRNSRSLGTGWLYETWRVVAGAWESGGLLDERDAAAMDAQAVEVQHREIGVRVENPVDERPVVGLALVLVTDPLVVVVEVRVGRRKEPAGDRPGGATIDARPSDALTLALVADVPIYVDQDVLDTARRTETALPEFVEEANNAPADGRALAEEARARLAANAEELAEIAARVRDVG